MIIEAADSIEIFGNNLPNHTTSDFRRPLAHRSAQGLP
jgi:hypothetical protein